MSDVVDYPEMWHLSQGFIMFHHFLTPIKTENSYIRFLYLNAQVYKPILSSVDGLVSGF